MADKLTKIDYAELLVKSPAWDGNKNPEYLARDYTLERLKDAYSLVEEAEEAFWRR